MASNVILENGQLLFALIYSLYRERHILLIISLNINLTSTTMHDIYKQKLHIVSDRF